MDQESGHGTVVSLGFPQNFYCSKDIEQGVYLLSRLSWEDIVP